MREALFSLNPAPECSATLDTCTDDVRRCHNQTLNQLKRSHWIKNNGTSMQYHGAKIKM